MRNVLRAAATAAGILAASPSLAVVVDGIVDLDEYGAPSAVVATDPAAPTSNFGTPGPTAVAGYNIYLKDIGDTLFGAIQQTGGTASGGFANLYFDIDPTTGTGGSEFGIELTNLRGFVAGGPPGEYFSLASAITFTTVATGNLVTTEFAIDESIFRQFIAGAALQGFFPGGYTEQNVRLNLSQSLGFSVAGGASYGPGRLGSFSVAASDVPEPASWAMMLAGFGGIGFAMRRRKTKTSVVFG